MVPLTATIQQIRTSRFESTLDFDIDILKSEQSKGRIAGGKINSSLVELAIPDELVIVGDLHGDLSILQRILADVDSERFFCKPTNKIVFLGDYIDRGSDSLRVLFTLLVLKNRYPESVILMRGNHEAPNRFPFSSHTLPFDIHTGMPNENGLYAKIISFFELLPLVTVVEERVVLVHGGLPIQFDRFNPIAGISQARGSDEIIEQILWNDPKDRISDGKDWEKSRRPYGFHFGEKITSSWLNIFGASVLIRSHEPCNGFNILHQDKVLTLFSCKESYPKFEPAYIQISNERLRSIKNASGLVDNIHKL